VDKSYRAKESS